jgi:hypothetical protein
MRALAALGGGVRPERLTEPPLDVINFPLQRGYSRPLVARLAPFAERVVAELCRRCGDPGKCPLVCTTPFYAPAAERWPGPVIYYLTDLTGAYEGLNTQQVRALDKRLCRVSQLVCPNSERIAEYLVLRCGCRREHMQVVPNATRQANILPSPSRQPAAPPPEIADLSRPLAGVIGNLAGNLDWELLLEVIERAPWLSWVFIGPSVMKVQAPVQRKARDKAFKHPQVRLLGPKPYGRLAEFARAFDVAVLPYRRTEPTFSGSSTRFYEHLAAGRPMLATEGVKELQSKEPLVRLAAGADSMLRALDELRARGFVDGFEEARWRASLSATWDERARSMIEALARTEVQASEPEARTIPFDNLIRTADTTLE